MACLSLRRQDEASRVLRHFQAMLPCHASELASLHQRVAKVAGRIVPAEGESRRLVSPLGKVECACYVVTVMAKRGSDWHPVATESDCVDFELTDETAVRVRVKGDSVAAAGYGWEPDHSSARFYKATPELDALLQHHGVTGGVVRAREVAFQFGNALAALGVVSVSEGVTLVRPIEPDCIPHDVLAHWRRADRDAWLALVEASSRVLLSDKPRVIEDIVVSASRRPLNRGSSLVSFTVPDDATPGSVVPVRLPDGATFLNCTIPDTVRPGTTITIAVPPRIAAS